MVVGFVASPAIRDLSDRDIRRLPSRDRRPSVGSAVTRRDVEAGPVEWVVDPALLAAAEQLVRPTLESLMALPFDWDSYGGGPLREPAALYAQQLLVPLIAQGVAPPAIVPTSDGGLSLEWDSGAKQLVIQVPAEPDPDDEPIAFYSDDEAGDEWEDVLSLALPRVREALTLFAT